MHFSYATKQIIIHLQKYVNSKTRKDTEINFQYIYSLLPRINMSPFTDNVYLTITPCYPSFFVCACIRLCFCFLLHRQAKRLKRRTGYALQHFAFPRNYLPCGFDAWFMRLSANSHHVAVFMAFRRGTLESPVLAGRILSCYVPLRYER